MNERKVNLPSGGTAWIVDRWPHGLATIVRRHHLRLAQFYATGTREEGSGLRRDLTDEERDQYTALLADTEKQYVRTFTLRWDVSDADGQALTFPDDIDRMDEGDFVALAGFILERRADPNGDVTPSGSSPEPASSRPTRISAKTSSRS